MKALLFSLLLAVTPLQAKVYSFRDFAIDFPGEPVIKTDGTLTAYGFTNRRWGFFVAHRFTRVGLDRLRDYRLGIQSPQAAVVGETVMARDLIVQGHPATMSFFRTVFQGWQAICVEVVVYALPDLYVISFFDYSMEPGDEDYQNMKIFFNSFTLRERPVPLPDEREPIVDKEWTL